jgi:hypothetical protein
MNDLIACYLWMGIDEDLNWGNKRAPAGGGGGTRKEERSARSRHLGGVYWFDILSLVDCICFRFV